MVELLSPTLPPWVPVKAPKDSCLPGTLAFSQSVFAREPENPRMGNNSTVFHSSCTDLYTCFSFFINSYSTSSEGISHCVLSCILSCCLSIFQSGVVSQALLEVHELDFLLFLLLLFPQMNGNSSRSLILMPINSKTNVPI